MIQLNRQLYFCVKILFQIILKKNMADNLSTNLTPKVYSLGFKIQKEVKYGEAIYVIGNIKELGFWNVSKALRLSWNNGHYWTATTDAALNDSSCTVCYKYIIGKWDKPQHSSLQWQIGQYNRQIQISTDKSQYFCENKWNVEKISLYLILKENQIALGTQFYVIGNCKQLGNWRQPKKMNQIAKDISQILNKTQKENKITVTYQFQVYRGKNKFHYYFMKKFKEYTIQRHPGRKYELTKGNKTHTRCLAISHSSGDTEIYEECNFKELVYSKVTPKIYLGAYLQSTEDIQLLKKQGVNSVLSIQTQSDFSSHSLTSVYLEHICRKNSIQFYSYQIEDMNRKDFVEKSQGALEIMKMLMRDPNNIIYVHCSAGVYRSSQLVVLYLTINEQYQLQNAIKFVREKHPVARPNQRVVEDALLHMSPKIAAKSRTIKAKKH